MEALATITSVRGLVTALQAIRTNQKLPCLVTFNPTGLQLRFLDGGHAMQSGIFLSASVGGALPGKPAPAAPAGNAAPATHRLPGCQSRCCARVRAYLLSSE